MDFDKLLLSYISSDCICLTKIVSCRIHKLLWIIIMVITMQFCYLLLSCNSKQILKSCLSTSEQNLSWIIALKNFLQKWQWVILKVHVVSVSSCVCFSASPPSRLEKIAGNQNNHGWRLSLSQRQGGEWWRLFCYKDKAVLKQPKITLRPPSIHHLF